MVAMVCACDDARAAHVDINDDALCKEGFSTGITWAGFVEWCLRRMARCCTEGKSVFRPRARVSLPSSHENFGIGVNFARTPKMPWYFNCARDLLDREKKHDEAFSGTNTTV